MRRARVVSNQNKRREWRATLFPCRRTLTPPKPAVHQTHCPLLLNSAPSPPFVRRLASCYLAPSGGSPWPASQPCFSFSFFSPPPPSPQCWFRLGARMLPLARGMSSRHILIIPPHFNGKPARHAGFYKCQLQRGLSQLFGPSGRSLANNAEKDLCDTVCKIGLICLIDWIKTAPQKCQISTV